jgi:hypothetical protein
MPTTGNPGSGSAFIAAKSSDFGRTGAVAAAARRFFATLFPTGFFTGVFLEFNLPPGFISHKFYVGFSASNLCRNKRNAKQQRTTRTIASFS